jgi:putative tryptophan/tyrosine transport system substrate-binding protein
VVDNGNGIFQFSVSSRTAHRLVTATTPAVIALQQATRTVPIVFVSVVDPVGSGVVASLSRPWRNVTGFLLFEYALAAKWLDVLKEIAPRLARASLSCGKRPRSAESGNLPPSKQWDCSASISVRSKIEARNADEIDRAVAEFSRGSSDGLIVTASQFAANHPEVITAIGRQA